MTFHILRTSHKLKPNLQKYFIWVRFEFLACAPEWKKRFCSHYQKHKKIEEKRTWGKKLKKKKIKICLTNLFDFFFKVRKRNEIQKKCSKFWVLKIAGKTYTSIPVLLFRSEEDLDVLV